MDATAKALAAFLAWLFSGETQASMPGGGRTSGRRTRAFWEIWPMPPRVEERHRVVYLDGIHLGRGACVPVACTDDAVLGWHLCRDENSRAWAALVSRIAAPEVAVSDGGDGLAKALRREWCVQSRASRQFPHQVFDRFCMSSGTPLPHSALPSISAVSMR